MKTGGRLRIGDVEWTISNVSKKKDVATTNNQREVVIELQMFCDMKTPRPQRRK